MYDGCFGLTRRPFAAVPQIESYFPASAIEGARTTLVRCVQRGEGTGLVVGPSGTGKTLLCMMLSEQFRRSFEIVMLQCGRLSTRRALFQAILYELGRPYRGLDEGEARLAVVDYLLNGDGCARGILLLVDEAHTLPLRLLEEIRLMTNLIRGNQPLVRLVLVGGPVLEEHFASPKLDSFSQRLRARCYLESLNRTETEQYIQSQVTSAGGCGDVVFPSETCQSVFQATGGVPRLINQVCDHALLLAYVAGRQQVDPAGIEEAWGDLQQLPTPWSGQSKGEQTGGGVIEFGSLDEQADAGSDAHAATTVSIPALRVASAADENEAEPVEQIHRIEELLAAADDDFQPAGSIGPELELRFDESPDPFQEPFDHEEVVADRYAGIAIASWSEPSAGESACVESPAAEREEDSFAPAESDAEPAEREMELAAAEVAAAAGPLHEVRREEPAHSEPPLLPPRPREYRQLFAQLRRV